MPLAPKARIILALMLVMLVLPGVPGCQSSQGAGDYTDIADTAGLFHFKIPATWQHVIEPGTIMVYAAKELPAAGEDFEALTLFVFSSEVSTTAPEAEELQAIIENRAQTRGWKDYTAAEPEEAAIGNRTGTKIAVSGLDGQGKGFSSEFFLIRTGNKTVGILAVAPSDSYADTKDDLADILANRWYWLTSSESSGTPSP